MDIVAKTVEGEKKRSSKQDRTCDPKVEMIALGEILVDGNLTALSPLSTPAHIHPTNLDCTILLRTDFQQFAPWPVSGAGSQRAKLMQRNTIQRTYG